MTRQWLHTNSEVCMYALTVSTIEPKNIKEAMADHSWIESMQDELNQFERLQVWELVPRPEGKNVIALKWLWKNKESFAPVAGLEAIRKKFMSANLKGFIVLNFQFTVTGAKAREFEFKKQDCTAMSTAEAEYVSLSAICAQVDLDAYQLLDYRILIQSDSDSITRERGGTCGYLLCRKQEYQLADLFTKALPKERFEYLVHRIVIIMAQQQHAADVHPDELCPPNKRYDLYGCEQKCVGTVQCPSDVLGFTMESRLVFNSRLFWSSTALADVMQDILQVLDYTRYGDGDNPPLRARVAFTIFQEDDIMKNIFNSGRNKNKVGMRIPAWMITDE
ncbi:hypothetical protein Tco_0682359 [Tanacetum coccineum]|uniref:Gag-Pol polyprotein n=1 Tax=Tanacetum coccineum TaxID=301880 RepID=A0ABQ4XQY0_9ASTR